MGSSSPRQAVEIPRRFNGPPQSANGGYACGTVARLLGAAAADVSLRAPPPLGVPLDLVADEGAVRLLDGDTVVAEGRALPGLELEAPEAVSVAQAREGRRRFPWYEQHAFPSCFVCGPRRPDADGLEIFAGPVEGRDAGPGQLVACEWTPAGEWADDSGQVATEIAWGALDCPTAVAAAELAEDPTRAAVLARLAASLDHPIAVEEPHVVVAWPIAREGRKRRAGSAIFDREGGLRARAEALWIEVRE